MWYSGQESACQCTRCKRPRFDPGIGKDPPPPPPLEEEMATHSSILAWETSWTEEPGGVQSMGHKS